MSGFRHHYYCEACDGTWLAEAEDAIEADCPFCAARDVPPYKSDTHIAGLDAATMTRRLAATMRQALRQRSARASLRKAAKRARMAS